MSYGFCQIILTKISDMKRVAAKILTNKTIALAWLLNDVMNDPNLLESVITGDETCIYGYHVESNERSHMSQNRKRTLISVKFFFRFNEVVHRRVKKQRYF